MTTPTLAGAPGRGAAAPATDLAFFSDARPPRADFLNDARAGLAARPRAIPPKYFYDARGSRLFEEICATPEYYLTRTELALLATAGPAIASSAGAHCTVIEFGAGSSRKISRLLDILDEPAGYVAIDISRDFLLEEMTALARARPDLPVGAVCADFTRPITLPEPAQALGRRRLGFLPGSTIGNFTPAQAEALLRRAGGTLGPGAGFLIGVDLKKDAAILDAAYDDAQGITAAFNRNLLRRMRVELGAELDEAGFGHVAFYNPEHGRVEMHLEARGPQTITLGRERFTLADGERIHTESSYKYTLEEFAGIARRAGFVPREQWTDPAGLFSLHMLEVPA